MPTPRLKPWLLFQWLFAAAVVWFAGRALAGQWTQVEAAFHTVDPRWSLLFAATLLIFVAYAVQIEAWRRLLGVWAAPLSARSAAIVWFAANLGKYVPGKIWSIAALSGMARDHGSSAVAAGASSVVMQVASIGTGITIATVMGSAGSAQSRWTVLGLTFGALALFTVVAPWILPPAIRLASRLTKRPVGNVPLPRAAILGAVLSTVVAWLIVGVAFYMLVRGLLPSPQGPITSYISAYAAASVAGFVALFAPGGIGVREAALVAAMTQLGLASAPDAAVIAVMTRIWMTVLDLGPGLTALVLSRSNTKREAIE